MKIKNVIKYFKEGLLKYFKISMKSLNISNFTAHPCAHHLPVLVCCIRDGEDGVFCRVPIPGSHLAYLNTQSTTAGWRQAIKILQAQPEVGVDRSEPGHVRRPWQLPVERHINSLLKDDPTKYRFNWNRRHSGNPHSRLDHFNHKICFTCNTTQY